jgi:V/A-type H+-transporting ATPase subunit E
MTDQERADQRIQAICEKIRYETLDPAKEQAQAILDQAKRERELILQQARQEAESLQKETRALLHEEKQVFQSSLQQACKQTLEHLMQKIEESLFNPALENWIKEQLGDAKAYARLIEVLISAIQKEGTQTNISVVVPKNFSSDAINAQLSQKIRETLKDGSVEVGDLGGGIKIRINGKKMTLDLSQETLREIVSSFIRKDFRKIFFT